MSWEEMQLVLSVQGIQNESRGTYVAPQTCPSSQKGAGVLYPESVSHWLCPPLAGVGWEYLRHVGMKALPLAQDKRPEKDDAAEPSVTAMQSSWGQACQPATRIWVEHPCRKPPQGETARGQTSEAGPLWVGKGPRQEPESQEKWGAGWSPKKLPPLCRGDQRAAERRASRARASQPAEPHRS